VRTAPVSRTRAHSTASGATLNSSAISATLSPACSCSQIFYGKGGDLATNRRDEQEMSVLCLQILQAALVYVNTLMIQDLLAEPEWADALTAEDQRGLAPLFWSHVLPYGEVKLNMTSRLPLSTSSS